MDKSIYRSGFLLFATIIGALMIKACGGSVNTLELKQTVTVSGTVINQTTNQPLAGTVIKIIKPANLQQKMTTDSNGQYRFVFKVGNPISITIKASKPNFQTKTKSFEVLPRGDYSNINFALVPRQ